MEGNIATDPSRLKGLILLDRDGVINVDHGYVGAVEDVIPVHIRIPGDPPTPAEILAGLARGLRSAR